MKIRLLLFFLLPLSNIVRAQNKVEISAQTEIFFIGVETPIKVTVNHKVFKADEYSIQDDSRWPGRISYRKTDSCLWVKPLRSSFKKELTILDKKGKLLGRKPFYALDIPNPSFSLDAYKGGAIQPGLLRSSLGLLAVHDNAPVKYPHFEISSYRAVITNGNETRSFTGKGPLISDSIRYYFQHLKFPYRVEFTDFTCDSIYYRYCYSSPLVFESRDDGNFGRGYWTEVGEYEDSLSKTLNLLPLDSMLYRQDYPKIVETNCNSTNDTCSSCLYYIIDGRKYLALIYQFQNDQSERFKTFYKGVQLSDITYWNEANAVNEKLISVSVNYSNGQLMKEGSYYMAQDTSRSYCYRRDPAVYDKLDTTIFVFRDAVKAGPWKYYASGKLIKTETYKNGDLVGVKFE